VLDFFITTYHEFWRSLNIFTLEFHANFFITTYNEFWRSLTSLG